MTQGSWKKGLSNKKCSKIKIKQNSSEAVKRETYFIMLKWYNPLRICISYGTSLCKRKIDTKDNGHIHNIHMGY